MGFVPRGQASYKLRVEAGNRLILEIKPLEIAVLLIVPHCGTQVLHCGFKKISHRFLDYSALVDSLVRRATCWRFPSKTVSSGRNFSYTLTHCGNPASNFG